MPENTDPDRSAMQAELSPVKRALLEIRQLRAALEESRRTQHEPIAIVGMALRLPGGVTTPERFWQALEAGEDLISAVPASRWEAGEYLHADADHMGTMYDAHGGFLADVDQFDAEFFGINAREAASMDPQQRMLLELSWEALERAGIDPKSLASTATGVYLGISGSDYGREAMRDVRAIHAYSAVGTALSIAAGRISYFLGLHGPSIVLDTACSSSLVAVHMASESLRRGETNLALVGGSNLILQPDCNVSFARTRMLSRDGHSKTFDAAADGYVRGEGCCMIVLKRYRDALRDGDRVLACIAGSAVNQDGRSAGLTAPNGPAQEFVIRAALDNAGIDPAAVSYVEAHGTGTPLGDPIEVQALGSVYGAARTAEQPLHIGSVKTNLGHTEAVAGLVGLIKVVLMMQPGHWIVPHLHMSAANPKIDFDRLHIDVPTKRIDWPDADAQDGREGSICAAVSAFGFSGTNSHVVLRSAPDGRLDVEPPLPTEESPCLLLLSGASDAALRSLVELYRVFLATKDEAFRDVCASAAFGRAHLSHRVALFAHSAQEASEMLAQWLAGSTVRGMGSSSPDSPLSTRIVVGNEANSLAEFHEKYLTGMDMRGRLAVFPSPYRRVDLPVYPFQRFSFWHGLRPEAQRALEREERWQQVRERAERQSRQAPLGWRVDRFEEKWALLDRLTLAHAQNALVRGGVFQDGSLLSPEEVVAQAQFQPLYLKLVTHWLEGLARAGVVSAKGGKFCCATPLQEVLLDPYWERAEVLLEDDPGTLTYLRQCSRLLDAVMTGHASALETLFPDGSFAITEGIYETGLLARYFNAIAAAAVGEAARSIGQRRNARILEIGGGTGGTTSAILPMLPSGQVEYWFTDLSELFLARARKKFSEYPFVHYGLFDLDKELGEQGIGTGQFDVIVAANVVHAARNLTAALGRVRQLLAPGGMLVLLESTVHHSWFDMTTGLIEGWQHFEDEERGDHPLLDPEQWRSVLLRSGFAEVAALPENGLPTSTLGQHVLLVRVAEAAVAEKQASQSFIAWKPQASTSAGAWEGGLASTLLTLPHDEREAVLLEFVRATIQRVFQLSVQPEELGVRERLSDLGMDSLIALELRGELVKGLGPEVRISSTIAFDTGTVGELTQALLQSLEPNSNEVQASHAASKPRTTSAPISLEEISEMSDEDVERLLNERLSRR